MKRKRLSTAQRIALSFATVILIGSLVLVSPFALKENVSLHYIDALFVAVSATCVTGLTPVVISETFNGFGKMVILMLIQIGGLGLMTIMASFVLFLRNRISLTERQTLKEMLNRSDFFNFQSFVKKVVQFTIIFEMIGALLLLPVFLKEMSFSKAIVQSVFTSVSAFCNAGFDLLGNTSLLAYHHHYYFQIVVMFLIVSGGIGFAVWSDLFDFLIVLKKRRSLYYALKKISTHSKLVLSITACLIFVPAIVIFLLEIQYFTGWNSGDSIMAVIFQSVTLRTAGFYTVDFSNFRLITLLFMMPIMFIGGSSGGTAGGVKTTTMFIVIAYLISVIKGEKELVIFKRTIQKELIMKAFTLILINVLVLAVGIFLLSLQIKDHEMIPYAFEAVSALATVGISTGITASVSAFGKVVLIALMYIGRIGIVTLVFSITGTQNKANANVGYPTGNVIVG